MNELLPFSELFIFYFMNRSSDEISNDRNQTTSITISIMRRHSLDPDNIRRHIKSIFTSPSRKLRNFTHHHHHNNDKIINSTRPRRFSVPEHKYQHRLDNNADLDTIDEVSNTFYIRAYCYLLCCFSIRILARWYASNLVREDLVFEFLF